MLDRKELGKRIKQAREFKSAKEGNKFTGRMLADELGISRGYLGDLESGRTMASEELLSKIVRICDLPFDFFEIDNNLIEKIIRDDISVTPDDEINKLEKEMKLLYSKMKHLSPSDRQKILKMIEIFETENGD